jgi:hypothetical protein
MNETERKARQLIRQGLQMLFNDVREVELSREDMAEIANQELDIVYEEFMQGFSGPVETEINTQIEQVQFENLAKKLRDHD